MIQSIADVRIKQLYPLIDEQGFLLEILRSNEQIFAGFGRAYISTINKGIVKGWYLHEQQIDNIVCISGLIKLVLYDIRKNSLTYGQLQEFFLGEQSLYLVQIPTGILHGWKGLSTMPALVLNLSSCLYDYANPDKKRIHPHHNEIPYDWNSCVDG